jgi:hypothetical protein|uniref:Uncharacterized protein ycf23 n=1 Tax=Cyanidiaceae sp. MX-AZ01 TaxID=1503164 RepID=A0A060A4U7_9RHOD|nr:hypothetical protein [Cyanidiaceae sp. MX-AZ01]
MLLKIITGLFCFEEKQVLPIVKAAEQAAASYVDIAAHAPLVHAVKTHSQIPVCVSGLNFQSMYESIKAGADMLEIGNYDALYAAGQTWSSESIVSLAVKLKQRMPERILTVTIPYVLDVQKQMKLVAQLEAIGVDMFQTEGGGRSRRSTSESILSKIESATVSLAHAYQLSRMTSKPVLCASGITAVTAPMAIAAGASGVGVGKAVSRETNPYEVIKQIQCALQKDIKPI